MVADAPGPAPAPDQRVRPRVVATDFDGTLLRSDLTLSARTRATLRQAEDAGLTVVVVTARPPRWMTAYADVVGGHGTVLAGNGAFELDVATGRVVVHGIDGPLLTRLAALLRDAVPGVVLAAETAHGMVCEGGFDTDPQIAGLDGAGATVVPCIEECPHPVGKLLARGPHLDPAAFHDRCATAVGDTAHLAYSGAVGLVEITRLDVTKASALQRFCGLRGVDARDVWAFGDMPNDVPMLTWAGRGYAVANAHPDAVAAATHRCPSNDEDGVAAVVEQVLRA